MSDLDDPYAPPKAPVGADVVPRKRRAREPDFDAEVRSVALVVVLSIVTLGIYTDVWYIRRQPFLDELDSDKKLGKAMAWAPLVTLIVVVVLGFLLPDDPQAGQAGSVGRALSGAAGAVSIVVALRVAHILRSHFARTGRLMSVSSAAAFFLGAWYLQHVINLAAATPGRPPPRKKKKSRQKSESEPPTE